MSASYDNLLAEEPGRKERINAYKEQKAKKAAEKKNVEAKIGK